MSSLSKREIISILNRGGVGVLLTDTIFGLVAPALNRAAVTRLYRLKRRRPDKPFIILIARRRDLKLFGVKLSPPERPALARFWPGPVSVILPTRRFPHLNQTSSNLAFRLPAKASLRALLRATGPLVAPSANPSGLPPAPDLSAARAYFGRRVDFYYGRGRPAPRPSRLLILFASGRYRWLRR